MITEIESRENKTPGEVRKVINAHHEWDFNEYDGYVSYARMYNRRERIVSVRNADRSVMDRKANLLFFLDQMTLLAQKHLLPKATHDRNVDVFLKINHSFYELPYNLRLKFRGVNKPKNVHECHLANGVAVGTDGTLRSHERYVFLILPDNNDDFTDLTNDYVHEIAHSLANHVLFRTDDHHEDFVACQEMFAKVLKQLNFSKRLRSIFN